MPTFVSGLVLSRRYFEQVVEPILTEALPGVPYAAGLVGDGSEVQGFDDARSTDHDWGPRVQLFFDPQHFSAATDVLVSLPSSRLPIEFEGHSTQYHRGDTSDAISRGIEIYEIGRWALTYLGVDPRQELALSDWLAIPWNLLRGATAGAVWRDDSGGLAAIRAAVQWYAPDLWRYIVACQWQRINQEEPFVGRAAELGKEVGSRIIAARQLREVMHLCFLLERQYPPYSKWLETGFARLTCADKLVPLMLDVTSSPDFATREMALSNIYEHVATLHNTTGISQPVDPHIQRFHDRPFRVLNSYRFVEATRAAITDDRLRSFSLHGCISQCVDSTDILSSGRASHHFHTVLGSPS